MLVETVRLITPITYDGQYIDRITVRRCGPIAYARHFREMRAGADVLPPVCDVPNEAIFALTPADNQRVIAAMIRSIMIYVWIVAVGNLITGGRFYNWRQS